MKFEEMPLDQTLQQALKKMNFESPTEIQAAAIPLALQGQDVLGSAQTGTGKTAAFAIPMLQKLIENPEQAAVILLPTRELAVQVEEVVRGLTFYKREIRSALLIGGVSMVPQFRALQNNPRVLIATPGRLIDHLERKSLSLKKTSFLILDEADRMLDMGFAPQIRDIVKHLPEKRQTLLFSATFPSTLIKLVREFMEKPARVSVNAEEVSPTRIKQQALELRTEDKQQSLLRELEERQGTILVFVRTQRIAEKIGTLLIDSGWDISIIHGGRTQAQRLRALQQFRQGLTRILVATDVAARGLDIPHVEHVINYDLPQIPEDYVHRIGRTGRAGRSGEALTFVTSQDRVMWRMIERLMNPHMKAPDEKRFASDRSLNKPQGRPAKGSNERGRDQRRDQRGPGPNKKFGGRRPSGFKNKK